MPRFFDQLLDRCKNFYRRIPTALRYAILVGLVLRLLGLWWVIQFGPGADGLGPLFNDGKQYVEFAWNLVRGLGFGLERPEGWVIETYRTPGLPLLLYPFLKLGLGVAAYTFVLSILAGILLPLLTWYIGVNTVGRRPAVFAAWLVAVEPLHVMLGWVPLSDLPALLFFLASFACAIEAWKKMSWKFAVLAGLLGGCSVFIRPGGLAILFFGYGLVLGYTLFRRLFSRSKIFALILICLMLMPTAWALRTERVTGTFTYLGMGWRDLYVNYLASVLSVENNEQFLAVKNRLKDQAGEFGLSRFELNNPANAAIIQQIAWRELKKHPWTIFKLQSLVYVSFFTNDGWYSYLMRFGFFPPLEHRVSPTAALLTHGFSAFVDIWKEMQRQWFIPIFGRLVTIVILLAAILGTFKRRRQAVIWLFVALILALATLSSVSGLGVEGRYRLGVAFLLYLLAGCAFPLRSRERKVSPPAQPKIDRTASVDVSRSL